MKTWGFDLLNKSEGGDNPPINKGWSLEGRLKLSNNSKTKITIRVYHNNNLIGDFIGVNNFIRDYLGIDRYENKKEFKTWSSKISDIIRGKRKTHKNYRFEWI